MKILEKSFKGKYPFRLATTSFIYPDLYSENIKKLGPYLDEIELLFFESCHPDSLPKDYEIRELADLKKEFDLSYNIHLPTDVLIAAANPNERQHAVAVISKFIKNMTILDPVTFTLHIEYQPGPGGEELWKTYAFKGIRALLENGMNPRLISVETLDYNPKLLKEILEEFDLSMCLDIGHLIVYGYDPVSIYEQFKDRISIIHLHGVQNRCDHISLDFLAEEDFVKIEKILNDFTASVSIEVFSFDDLNRSLAFLNKRIKP